MSDFDWSVLYDYAVWANGRVLHAAEALTAEQWGRPMGHSFGSVQATMVHILSSEILWLARWQGQSPRDRAVTPDDIPTVGQLRTRWGAVNRDMWTFIGQVNTAQWRDPIGYQTLDGRDARYPLWQMYLQVINHGTHHRAEAATMLTELGHAPEPLDMIFHFRERQLAGA